MADDTNPPPSPSPRRHAVPRPRLLRVLFVDTYVARASEVRRILEREVRGGLLPECIAAFDVVKDGLEALTLVQNVPYDAILLSSALQDLTADELASDLLHLGVRAPLILLAPPNTVEASQATARGYRAIVMRPLSAVGLSGVIRALCLPSPVAPAAAAAAAAAAGAAAAATTAKSTGLSTSPPSTASSSLPQPPNMEDEHMSHKRKRATMPRVVVREIPNHDGSMAAATTWQPPQILRIPVSETLGYLQLPKKPAGEPFKKGWHERKKNGQATAEGTAAAKRAKKSG